MRIRPAIPGANASVGTGVAPVMGSITAGGTEGAPKIR